jgi:hypothetical protein
VSLQKAILAKLKNFSIEYEPLKFCPVPMPPEYTKNIDKMVQMFEEVLKPINFDSHHLNTNHSNAQQQFTESQRAFNERMHSMLSTVKSFPFLATPPPFPPPKQQHIDPLYMRLQAIKAYAESVATMPTITTDTSFDLEVEEAVRGLAEQGRAAQNYKMMLDQVRQAPLYKLHQASRL